MRIEFKKEGGVAYLPGLAKPVVIDTGKLDPKEVKELESLLDRASFSSLPSVVGSVKRGAADYQTWSIRVEGDRSNTVRVVDPDASPGVSELIQWLERKSKEIRKAGAGG